MNASVPTLDELVQIAIDYDAIGQIGAAPTVAIARQHAAEAVVEALNTWEFDAGVKAVLPPQMLVIAMLEVLGRGWNAREEEWDRRQREAGE